MTASQNGMDLYLTVPRANAKRRRSVEQESPAPSKNDTITSGSTPGETPSMVQADDIQPSHDFAVPSSTSSRPRNRYTIWSRSPHATELRSDTRFRVSTQNALGSNASIKPTTSANLVSLKSMNRGEMPVSTVLVGLSRPPSRPSIHLTNDRTDESICDSISSISLSTCDSAKLTTSRSVRKRDKIQDLRTHMHTPPPPGSKHNNFPSPVVPPMDFDDSGCISSPASDQSDASSVLPDAEVAYSFLHYYTECPHTSPPSTRPLNTQPQTQCLCKDVLRHPPVHIVEILGSAGHEPSAFQPSISVIDGKCSICDHVARREAESDVIAKFARRLTWLRSEYSRMSRQLVDLKECLSSPTTLEQKTSSRSGELPLDTAEVIHNSSDLSVTETRMEQVKHQIQNLMSHREREVRKVWSGYTQRWGPGTVGVHNTSSNNSTNRESVGFIDITTRSTTKDDVDETQATEEWMLEQLKNVDGVLDDGRMVVNWIRPGRRRG